MITSVFYINLLYIGCLTTISGYISIELVRLEIWKGGE